MVRPRNRGERRRRNFIAKDLRTKKYAPKVIPAATDEDDDWKDDLNEYYNRQKEIENEEDDLELDRDGFPDDRGVSD